MLSGHPAVWSSGFPVWKMSFRDRGTRYRFSGLLAFRPSGLEDVVPRLRNSEPVLRSSGYPPFRVSGLLVLRPSGYLAFRLSGPPPMPTFGNHITDLLESLTVDAKSLTESVYEALVSLNWPIDRNEK